MKLSQALSSLCLTLYSAINKTGLLDQDWAQKLFIKAYFIYKKYLEDATPQLIQSHPELFREGHILDIGANIGFTAYLFSQALSSPYQVIAFEPEEKNLSSLRKVADFYGFRSKLEIVAAAVGEKDGEVELWRNDDHHADHRVITEAFRKQLDQNSPIQETKLVSVDHYLKSQHSKQAIAFIKIDVQGYELPVCQGMKETLAANPDCAVSFEYCPSIMQELGYSSLELLNFFKERGYSFYRLHRREKLIPLDLDQDSDLKLGQAFKGYFDILCTPKSIHPQG